ncbi:hypothetical protein GGF46_000620 [Coemansia sp. RSA 552]|nr:hypothetical protein GGF46_000620 [Coemansia sp. RSA 552]
MWIDALDLGNIYFFTRSPSEDIRIDEVLVAHPNTFPLADPDILEHSWFKGLLLQVEAKGDVGEQGDAYAQAHQYQRQAFAEQPNLDWGWGMTLCSSVARVLMFTHDYVSVSDELDLATQQGLHRLIRFLVALSYCEGR